MKKYLITLLILGFAGVAYAAPSLRYERTLLPVDSTENIGTSTSRWDEGWFNSINVTSCTGCSGGGFSWPFTKLSTDEQATSTTLGFFNGFLSLASSSVNVAGLPLTLTNTTDQASNQVLVLQGDRATPANNDEAYISFKLSDSAGNQDEFGRITVVGGDVTSTSEDGDLKFAVVSGGTLGSRMQLSPTTLRPFSNDLIALGTATVGYSDLFLASGGVINWANGNASLTHTSGNLTLSSGDIFNASDSIITNSTTTSATTTTFAVSGLTSGRCVETSTGGALIVASAACGSGSGGIAWPFTKLSTNEQATSTTLAFLNGFLSTASSTLTTFNFTNATGSILTLGSGGAGDSTATFGPTGYEWSLGFDDTDDAFVLSSSTALGTNNVFSVAKATLLTTFSDDVTIAGSFDVDGLTSALTLTGATGVFAEYTGTSCTNQFVRSLSALGVATCATVGAADVDLADLTATNSTLTFSGTYDGQTARTIGLNLANANTWTGGQTFGNATSTNLNLSGNHISFGSNYVSATSTSSFNIASSTLVNGASYNRATTTIQLAPWAENRKIVGVSCMATSTGGVIFRVGGKTNQSAVLFCNGNPRTYTFTAIQVAAFTDFLNVAIEKASSTADRVYINVFTQKVSD